MKNNVPQHKSGKSVMDFAKNDTCENCNLRHVGYNGYVIEYK